MNDYRITYKIGEETEETRLTERNEAAARKDFKAHCKDGTILNIELVAENVNATKGQEREALATIRKIVEELGPNSYVGTAFEGCFRDAEDNIENDFGCSMKQKLESAEFAEDELRKKLAEVQEAAHTAEMERDAYRKRAEEAERKALPVGLYQSLWTFLYDEEDAARKLMAISAENMATMADTPKDIAFAHAVESYRKAKARAESCERMADQLDSVKPEGA